MASEKFVDIVIRKYPGGFMWFLKNTHGETIDRGSNIHHTAIDALEDCTNLLVRDALTKLQED